MTGSASANGHPFSAASSATGYLYQCRYALLEALRRTRQEYDFQVHIETLDDVVFDKQGSPPELLQTKHHVKQSADLTDASVDLWKTLRIWCEGIAGGSLRQGSRFILVTTAAAGSGSAAEMLRPGSTRNVSGALDRLRSRGYCRAVVPGICCGTLAWWAEAGSRGVAAAIGSTHAQGRYERQ